VLVVMVLLLRLLLVMLSSEWRREGRTWSDDGRSRCARRHSRHARNAGLNCHEDLPNTRKPRSTRQLV
jgi:hypothetical protein